MLSHSCPILLLAMHVEPLGALVSSPIARALRRPRPILSPALHPPASDRRSARPGPSVLPEAVEAPRVHLRITRRVGDLPVPQIGGQGPRIDALVHQLKAASMAQQVRVNAS